MKRIFKTENPCVAGSIPVLAKIFLSCKFWPEKKANCLALSGIEVKPRCRPRTGFEDGTRRGCSPERIPVLAKIFLSKNFGQKEGRIIGFRLESK